MFGENFSTMKKIEVVTDIKTTPARAISAFTDFEALRQWWNVDRSLIDKQVNGVYVLAWNIRDSGFGYISAGVIAKYDPDSLLVIDKFVYMNPDKPFFGPMTLTIKATPKNDQVELYICQDGYGDGSDWDWYYKAVKQAWPVVAQAIKNYLEGNTSQG
jgi:uncharacterized protein YndB with AHSA1/START domain